MATNRKSKPSGGASRRSEVEVFILEHVRDHPEDIARVTAEHFDVSRQAIHRYMKRLVDEQKLVATGATRSRRYAPAVLVSETLHLEVSPSFEEDRAWSEHIRPLLQDVPTNVVHICQYGATEMLNNVKDHSGSLTVEVDVARTTSNVVIAIVDRGVGIFKRIAKELSLLDERHAVLELSKGKLTTDPERHTGEGVFFTSRAFDVFQIVSGSLNLHCSGGESWLLDEQHPWLPVQHSLFAMEGTMVAMMISVFSGRKLNDVFDRHSDEREDYGFTRTQVPVSLARLGDENLVSRSQAKRLLARFDRFREVLLDFTGVESVGQAFADEIFRVFRNEHADVHLSWINAVPQVEQMIKRAIAAR